MYYQLKYFNEEAKTFTFEKVLVQIAKYIEFLRDAEHPELFYVHGEDTLRC